MKFSWKTSMFFLSCLAQTALAVAPPPQVSPSDESGTLVMAAKTGDAVILSVDSKITHDNFVGTPQNRNSHEKKISNVGTKSSCAIDGFLYSPTNNIDIISVLKKWVEDNPKIEISEGINELLVVGENEWNRGKYDHIDHRPPGNRKENYPIFSLTCIEFKKNTPMIVRGETKLNADFSARHERLDPVFGDLLYAEGRFENTEQFVELLSPGTMDPKLDCDKKVRIDIENNVPAQEAFKAWIKADKSVRELPPTVQSSSVWNRPTAKELFTFVYDTVEKYPCTVQTPDGTTEVKQTVGPPNNVTILMSCGRVESKVEEDWPTTCPVRAPIKKKH
jgi:hypothetical protein